MIRSFVTAVALLIAGVLLLEFWLRTSSSPSVPIVAGRVALEWQTLLMPSRTLHHELIAGRLDASPNSIEAQMPGTTTSLPDNKTEMRETGADRSNAATVGPASRRSGDSIRINRLGLRGAEIIPVKPAGIYRILLLGDETVFGVELDESETLARRVHDLMSRRSGTAQRIEVINGGIPGYCPLLNALQFERVLYQLQPDLVIAHFDMSDVADDGHYRRFLTSGVDANSSSPRRPAGHGISDEPAAMRSETCPHPAFRRNARPQAATGLVMSTVQSSAIASRVVAAARVWAKGTLSSASDPITEQSPYAWISDTPPDLRIQVRHAIQPLETLDRSVKQSGGRLLVATSPVLWQVLSGEEAPELSRRCGVSGVTPFTSRLPFEVLAEFCQQKKIAFCDTSESFRSSDVRRRLFSRSQPRLTDYGIAVVAREVCEYLYSNPPSEWQNETQAN